MASLWRMQTKDLEKKANTSQNISKEKYKDIYWDVIVVGAGLAGLLTAYYLQEMGKKVLVLEAKTVASGQTERTTAKITSQHALKYTCLVKDMGRKNASLYAMANEMAIREYERFISKNRIKCDFKRVPAYLYTLQEKEISKLEEEAKLAKSFGIDAFFTTQTELPFPVKGAVCFRNQAQFSPLEFVKFLSDRLKILEYTKVIKIKGHQVITSDAVFEADKIVMTTHYPILNVPGFYFLRQHQERSYVLALSDFKISDEKSWNSDTDSLENYPIKYEKLEGMYYGIDKNGLSLRQAGDYLLLGGSSHRTGENCSGQAYEFLRTAANEHFPGRSESACWAAQDCMPHDGIPFIGKYSMFIPNLYVATGFQKWGMTSSMVAAILLRDEICEIQNPYRNLFSPQRMNIIASFLPLMTDVGVSVKGLTKGLFHKKKRCPHMGCELTWNAEEKSWDCPCHGSRFDINGKLLDNPSKKDFTIQ